jgi:hypothetical protein
MDKCKYCDSEAEYKCLVEDDENPLHSHTEDVCSECMTKIQYGLIESWTKKEWLNMDD